MRRLTTALVVLATAIAAFSGCQRSSVISIAPPPPLSLYTSDFGTNALNIFSQPLGPASTPALTITAASLGIGQVNGVGSDSAGHFLMVDTNTNIIYLFHSPLTATSTIAGATTIGPPAGASIIRRFGFDPSGNLWGADGGTNELYEWSPPFGAAAPNFTITASVPAMNDPLQPVFDNAGHMFVANFSASTLYAFAFPTASATPAVNANIATCPGPVDIGIDVTHRVFISCNVSGDVQVFAPPYATGNLPAFTISPPGGTSAAQALRFDAAGNLYVSYLAPDSLAVFSPPYSPASSPLFVFSSPQITSMAFAN